MLLLLNDYSFCLEDKMKIYTKSLSHNFASNSTKIVKNGQHNTTILLLSRLELGSNVVMGAALVQGSRKEKKYLDY